MSTVLLPQRITSSNDVQARKRQYELNRRYYEHGMNRSAYRPDQQRRKLTPRNFTAVFVDTVSAHMGAHRLTFGEGFEQWDELLELAYALEETEELDYSTEVQATVDGHGGYKVTWDDVERRVRIATVDTAGLWVESAPDDPRNVLMIAQQYSLHERDLPALFEGQVVVSPSAARSGVHLITEEWTRDTLRYWVGNEPGELQPNPYGFIPYSLFPNLRLPGRTWGTGDPERLAAIQDQINFEGTDTDTIAALQGAIIALEGVEGTTDIAVRPGAIWELPPDAKAYTLDIAGAAGMTQRLAYHASLLADFHVIGRVPRTALGDTGRELSGSALQHELGPLLRLVARKRLTRTPAYRRRALHVLALLAKFGGAPAVDPSRVPAVVWTDAIAADRADELANAASELALGRSHEQVLRSVGVEDPASELAARAREEQMLGGMSDDRTRSDGEPSVGNATG